MITINPDKLVRNVNTNGEFIFRGGLALQAELGAQNVRQFGRFLRTPQGARFVAKQAILQRANPKRNYIISEPGEKDKQGRSGIFQDSRNYNPLAPVLSKALSQEFTTLKPPRHLEDVGTIFRNTINNVGKIFGKDVPPISGEKAVTFFSKDRKVNLQVSYDGDLGETKKLNSGTNLPKDFIKFRIRDAVNGKWIIFPALLSGGISDNSSAEASPTQYIGRADKVYVYGGYTRSISFSINVVALSEKDIPIIWEKVNYAKGLVLPQYRDFTDIGVNQRPVAPVVNLTLGDLYNDTPGFFTSVNMSIPENSTWELKEGKQVPHICTLAFEFTYIGKENPTMQSRHFDNISNLFEYEEQQSDKTLPFTRRFLSREQRKSVRKQFRQDIDNGISRRDARRLRRARRRGLRQENRNA